MNRKNCRTKRVTRNIEKNPDFDCFKPIGVPRDQLEKVELFLDEYEAIRLFDLEGKNTQECAEQMGVSPATFNRIVQSARKKVADAIVNGKGIRIFHSS